MDYRFGGGAGSTPRFSEMKIFCGSGLTEPAGGCGEMTFGGVSGWAAMTTRLADAPGDVQNVVRG